MKTVIQFPDLTAIPIKEAQNNLVVSLLWLKNSYQKTATQKMMGIIQESVQKEMISQ